MVASGLPYLVFASSLPLVVATSLAEAYSMNSSYTIIDPSLIMVAAQNLKLYREGMMQKTAKLPRCINQTESHNLCQHLEAK